MKRYLIYCFVCGLWSFGLSGCDSFLDVKPKGVLLPETLQDYEAMLNSPTMTRTFPIILLDFTDDLYHDFDLLNRSASANGYYWRAVLTENEKANPDVWGPLYRVIYNTNVIINGAPQASDATASEIESVVAEALVIRAACYLDLLTVFANAYDPETAAADSGLPLVTSISVTDQAPNRSSVQETLNLMIGDVRRAIEALPAHPINRYRVSTFAAHGLLARIYLYMGAFDEALMHTNHALEGSHQLLNYNDYATDSEVPSYERNPEVLWQRAAVSGTPLFMLYSDDLLSYLNETDKRFEFLTVANNSGFGRSSFAGSYNFGITYPELYLTKAEVLARKGETEAAMDLVNHIRRHRIRTGDYVVQTALTTDEALDYILSERRRELAFSGLRWFDMKRLDREGRMPEIHRIDRGDRSVLATLAPHGANYTFEIPIRVRMFNPAMPLNHP